MQVVCPRFMGLSLSNAKFVSDTLLKIILSIVAAAIVIGVLAGFLLWKEFSGSASEALEFAKTADDQMCLDESLSRLADCGGTGCQIRSLIFAHMCFPTAAPSYQLCEGVPTNFFEMAVWPIEQCDGLDLPASACERIHTQAAKTCLALERDPAPVAGPGTSESTEAQLGKIASIGATVTALRFYESGDDPIDADNLDYRTRFTAETARYIYWELIFEFPELAQKRSIDLSAIYYWPDGTVMSEMVRKAELEAGWDWSMQGYGWGWPEAGNWPPGSYHVEVYADKQQVAAGRFVLE